MSLTLYYAPGACSFIPHTLLECSGAPFDPVWVKLHKGEQQSAEYKAINPRGQVPVLVDDGHVVTQILAIIGYLNDRFPELHYLPSEPLARAKVMETLAWMNNTIHPTFTHIFMPQKFTDNPALHDELRRHATAQYRGLLGELQAIVQAAKAADKTWLGGEYFGPLDAYTLTVTRWGTIAGINPEDYPELWALVQQVAAHPGVARVIARERLQLNLYKPS